MYGITNAGGGSGTKSTLIISIDSGSTVQVYANSTYTTLIKTATEKTAGQFWVKGLDNGTYYLKATKSGQTTTMEYTISEYGVYRITMSYFQFSLTVTFPATCTSVSVSNGSDTYSVPSASLANGTYTFTMRTPSTWSATAVVPYTYVPETSNTEGQLAKGTPEILDKTMTSDSADGSTNGGSATLPLKLYIYNGSLGVGGATGANACPDITTKWGYSGNGTTTYGTEFLTSPTTIQRDFPWGFIDITPFSSIHYDGELSRVDQSPQLRVDALNTSQRYHWTGSNLVTVSLSAASYRMVISGDVSSVNDQCIICLMTNYAEQKLYHLWLE